MQKPLFLTKKSSHPGVSGEIVLTRKIYGTQGAGNCYNLKLPKYGKLRSFDPPTVREGIPDPVDQETAAIGDAIAARRCRLLPVAAVAGMNGGDACRS